MAKKIKAIKKTRNLKTTISFMVFFVVSTFRAFVIKDLFLLEMIQIFLTNKPAYLLVQVKKPAHQIQVDRLVDVVPLHFQKTGGVMHNLVDHGFDHFLQGFLVS